MKSFNVTGVCVKEKHYMVDTGGKIEKIMELVGKGQYFTINRARQYGKTTTLFTLTRTLPAEYTCVSLSFEGVGETMFSSPSAFCQRFLLYVSKALEKTDREFAARWPDESVTDFDLLGFHIDTLCADRKVVLLIDEVDRTSDNRVFLHFLGMLRSKYLAREMGQSSAFHSVILAGVYNIKNIKLKLINEGAYADSAGVGRIYNSPWNIAADFNVDMSFRPAEIATMLAEYETDHTTGMDIGAVSDEIYAYTDGYPFLVSRICKRIDEEQGAEWSVYGVRGAVRAILREQNVLFDDLAKNLENNRELYDFLYGVLITGERIPFVVDVPVIEWAGMFGFIKGGERHDDHAGSGYVAVSNRIFEMRISNYFISKDENASRMECTVTHGMSADIVKNGHFDMELCLRKFAEHYKEIFAELDAPFLERHGRLLFLSYLRPLINGGGFCHIESQFTDLRRMDIVVDYGREQFIVELKLWKGEAARNSAYEQLLRYMNAKNAESGYLLTFDFRKARNEAHVAEWVYFDGRQIFEVIV